MSLMGLISGVLKRKADELKRSRDDQQRLARELREEVRRERDRRS